MNKTVNINIGGLFFHIDEDVYQKLNRYFDAIKRSLSNSSGKEEIMKDIEMRVAELLTEKQLSEKHVVNNKDVDDIILIMGQPEDYRIEEETSENTHSSFEYKKARKLYRDRDNATIGGVLAGLGHYFGIEKIWLRIAFLCLVFFGGTGIVAYIILWIVIPEAKTTSEKLEMRGEPINISNIEKKVKAEFDSLSDKIKNTDYEGIGNKIKSSSGQLGDVIIEIFKVFGKILGGVIVFAASISLIGILIASIMMIFFSTMPDNFLTDHINSPLGLELPLWIQGILFFLAFGIPFFFLIILGLKLIVTNLKSIGSTAKYGLLALWILAVLILTYLGIKRGMDYATEEKVMQRESFNIAATDTLFVKFKNNDFYSKNVDETTDFRVITSENNKKIIYSNDVSIEILKTDEKYPMLKIEKIANGKNNSEAKNRAAKIEYSYKIEGNNLILDNYFITDFSNKSRGQEVRIYLYLPKGTLFRPDASLQEYDESDNDFFNLHYSGDYKYKVENKKVICLDCPANEDEYEDLENLSEEENDNFEASFDSISDISIGKKGIMIKKQGKKEEEFIKIDGEGVKIRTK
jgi:phage shock protein PspC (stress-responsive transcriptional regulator)